MTLEFRPPFQIDPYRDTATSKLQALNQTINSMGNDALQYRQMQMEKKRQDALLALQQAQDRRSGAAARSEYGYDAGAGEQPPVFDSSSTYSGAPFGGPRQPLPMAPSPSSSTPQGTMGPQSMAPTVGGRDPMMSYADTPDQATPTVDHTSHFMNWKSQGMPMSYNHPDYGGNGQGMPQNPMDLYQTLRGIPGSKNQEIFLKAQDESRKQREEADKYGMGGANSLYSTPEQAAFQLAPNDPTKQKQYVDNFNKLYPAGKVPKSAISTTGSGIHFEVTSGTKDDQFTQKRLTALGDALDPSKQRQGAFGVSKQVFDRAERLESLASAFKDGNLDSRQMEELAIGLNAMLSGSNTGAQEQVKSLVPRTIWGNAQKVKEWLTNEPQGMQQQQFVQRMLGSIGREKSTAADQIKRTQFSRIGRYSDLETKSPDAFYNQLQSNGIDPEEYKQWKKGGYKPMSAVQAPDNSSAGPAAGMVRIQDSQGQMHDLPKGNLDAAKKRDPGLQVIH